MVDGINIILTRSWCLAGIVGGDGLGPFSIADSDAIDYNELGVWILLERLAGELHLVGLEHSRGTHLHALWLVRMERKIPINFWRQCGKMTSGAAAVATIASPLAEMTTTICSTG